MKLTRLGFAALAVLFSQFAVVQAVSAQAAYPTAKPINLVVPFPAGGGTDIVARLVAVKLGEALKAHVIVENKPGASAQIGNKYVVDAAPDGYTLLVGTTSLINGPALFGSKRPYDHTRQLRPTTPARRFPVAMR